MDEAYLQLLDEGWIDQAIDLVQSQRKKTTRFRCVWFRVCEMGI